MRLENHTQEIEAVRTEWLTALQKLISEINTNFSKFFLAMGCAGEVDLHKGENEVRIMIYTPYSSMYLTHCRKF